MNNSVASVFSVAEFNRNRFWTFFITRSSLILFPEPIIPLPR
ncbi:MAG: hypothetical protein ACI8P0_005105 [Planctomycetaceae bacterium]|jgi:hypothetical protein